MTKAYILDMSGTPVDGMDGFPECILYEPHVRSCGAGMRVAVNTATLT